jgi:LPPG:FO 2-phospho-L-lactate transferase
MSEAKRTWRSVVALSGGVGGARFAYGLSRALEPEALTVIVNTGDDLVHWGLSVSPDLDTVMYTLADLSDDERGWGLQNETFHALEGMRRYGADAWFMLGDRDLATHLERTRALSLGETLSDVTERLRRALGVTARILPMADEPCRTQIDTEAHGTLPFQDWFVRHRARPIVKKVWFNADPSPTSGALRAIAEAELVVIGPSNPYVSIDPILTRPGLKRALAQRPVVAVSPIIGGKAVKGPLGEMIPELAGLAPSAAAVAHHYGDLLSGFVVQSGDGAGVAVPVLECDTLMRTKDDRTRLARQVLSFGESVCKSGV